MNTSLIADKLIVESLDGLYAEVATKLTMQRMMTVANDQALQNKRMAENAHLIQAALQINKIKHMQKMARDAGIY